MTTVKIGLLMAIALSATVGAQELKRVPLVAGLTLVSATQLPAGDQENVVTVSDVSPQGVNYRWSFRQQRGNSIETGEFRRFVRVEDLMAAPRLNAVFFSTDVDRFPGSTAFSISRAMLEKLKTGAAVSYSFAKVDGVDVGTGMIGAIGGGLLRTRVYMRGTLTRAATGTVRMNLLVNGRRVSVPVVQARGSFALRDQKLEGDFFVLDDAEHPLLLRAVVDGAAFQMVRVDFPQAGSVAKSVESDLVSACRAEIPGVYFEFASAALRPESNVALRDVAEAVARHPDWRLSIEGHTDATGNAASNVVLSSRRADAVRVALSARYRVPATRLSSAGFGQSKPREPNTTLEGRARNRRVEIVRACPGR